jgi:phosphatidate cytidylyltransferase
MFRSSGSVQQPRWLVVTTSSIVSTFCFGPVLYSVYPLDCPLGKPGWALCGLLLGLAASFIYEMTAYDVASESNTKGKVTHRIARAVLIYAYLVMLIAFLAAHRFLQHDNHLGQIALITLISTVKLSDSFAFFAGRRFGTIKLAPKLSPGKTVQGSLGGLVGGCVAAAINVWLVAPLIYGVTLGLPWWWFIVYGMLVSTAGVVGDLAESMIKRDCGTKDSSTWLKGLGGLVDIVDSLVFAAPISWLLWILFT